MKKNVATYKTRMYNKTHCQSRVIYIAVLFSKKKKKKNV